MLKPPAAMTLYYLLLICYAAVPTIRADASQLVTSGNGFVYDAPSASSFDLTQIEEEAESPPSVASTSARHYEEFEIQPATSFAVTLDKSSSLSSAFRYTQPHHIETEMQPTVFVTPAPPAAAAPLVPSPTVHYTEEQNHHHRVAPSSLHYSAPSRSNHAPQQYAATTYRHDAPYDDRNHNAASLSAYRKSETKDHQVGSQSSNRYLPVKEYHSIQNAEAAAQHHEHHLDQQANRHNYDSTNGPHASHYSRSAQNTQHSVTHFSSTQFRASAARHATSQHAAPHGTPHFTARYSPIDPSAPLFVTPLPTNDVHHRSAPAHSAFIPITPPPGYKHLASPKLNRFVPSERIAHNFRKTRSKGYTYDVPSSAFNE